MVLISHQLMAVLLFVMALNRCALAEDFDCLRAATIAEKEHSLPAGLLNAIGEVESNGNPLAINVDGAAVAPADANAAAAIVKTATAEGSRFVDVGCFQVDLHWHLNAFPTLVDAFNPLRNARSAAQFLALLHKNAPSWETAVARYHSNLAVEGTDYARRVFARWRGDPVTFENGKIASANVRAAPRLFAFGIRVIRPGERASPELNLPIVVTP